MILNDSFKNDLKLLKRFVMKTQYKISYGAQTALLNNNYVVIMGSDNHLLIFDIYKQEFVKKYEKLSFLETISIVRDFGLVAINSNTFCFFQHQLNIIFQIDDTFNVIVNKKQ